MIARLRSELLRFRSRRLVKALSIVALLGMATIVVILAVKSNPPPGHAFTIHDAYDVISGTASLLAIAGWLIGTSLVGAEWQAGTMTTLLTWEPRRFRVLVAKTLAAAIGVFVMILALELVFTGLMALVAAMRGSTAGTDASLVRSIVGLDVRVAAVAAVGGVLGLALATVTRNTAAALGVAFVYLAIVEGLIRGFWQGWRAWLLGDNATIFVLAQNDGELGRTLVSAGLVVLVWCAVLLSVAMVSFRVRDVG